LDFKVDDDPTAGAEQSVVMQVATWILLLMRFFTFSSIWLSCCASVGFNALWADITISTTYVDTKHKFTVVGNLERALSVLRKLGCRFNHKRRLDNGEIPGHILKIV
jgi:hypothetical protein